MLEHTKDGFLAGTKIEAAETARWLAGIKGDTGKILALMRGAAAAPQGRTAAPAGRGRSGAGQSAAAGAPGGRQASAGAGPGAYRGATATPSQRASMGRMRDAAGRFAASAARPSGAESAAASAAGQAATATRALADTVEKQRKDAKADQRANNQKRGTDGRFGADGRGGGGLTGALTGGAGSAIDGAEQVDPLLGAVGEVRGLVRKSMDIAMPIGRAAGGLLKGGDGTDGDASVGLLRRMWRELRAMRKADAAGNKSTLAKLSDLAKVRGGESGGGLLSALGGLLPGLLPGLGVLAPALGGLGAAAAAASVGMRGLVKRVPVLGSLVEVITGALEDRRLAGDMTLTPVQRREKRIENAGSTGGGIAGALAGAAVGQAMIPIPVVGAVIGAVAGGYMGSKAGKAVGGGTARATERWAGGAKDDIVQGSAKAGVDPGLVAQIANFESGFDSEAKPIRNGIPMSSAHGYGQFLDSTWVDTVRKRGEKHGVVGAAGMTKEQALGLRGDKKLQAGMLAELTADNVKLGRSLGGKDDAANVYALHNLGSGDGGKFLKALKANPGAPVSSILSKKVIDNNKSLYKDGSISVGEAYSTMGKKMEAGNKYAADARGAAPAIVAAAPGAATAKAKTPAPAAAVAAAVPAGAPVATTAAVAMPKALAVPPAPAVVAMAAIPAMPQMDAPGPQRVNSAPGAGAAAPAPSAPPSQDVRDRLIAHVVTGGMGGYGGTAHR